MTLSPGSRLGPYEILAPLGAGGMGEVYRARDGKLHRDVALKVLPELFALDADRLARFTREAHVLASLNHPHIAAIHGLEDSDGVRALVLELVEGPTLADRIAQGPIPLDEALPIARQIAEALEAAHELGIIHRDLKPANIKVKDDGTVKVLDFGLAKALAPDAAGATAGDASLSPTITSPAATRLGVILGTAAYMSPEQARGKPVDRRADIWAFGCVLHEMLTGQRAFDDEDLSLTLSKVLQREPNFGALPAAVPGMVRQLLRLCLTKNPKHRLQDIGDARLALEGAFHVETENPKAVATAVQRAVPVAVALLGAIAVAAVAIVATVFALRGAGIRAVDAGPTYLTLGMDPADELGGPDIASMSRLTRTAFALSPDGRRLVFAAWRGAAQSLYQRVLDRPDAQPIPGTERALNPFFSPDGEWVAYSLGGQLWKIRVAGGPPVPLARIAGSFYGASWGTDGNIVFSALTFDGQPGGLKTVSADGSGAIRPLTAPQGSNATHRLPWILPGARDVLFTVFDSSRGWDAAQIAVVSIATGRQAVLLENAAHPVYSTTGHVLFLRQGSLWATAFDANELRVIGEAAPVVESVTQATAIGSRVTDTGAGQFALSESGTLVDLPGGVLPAAPMHVKWVNRAGQREDAGLATGTYYHPRVSPDGSRIAVAEQSGPSVHILDLARRIPRRLQGDGVNVGAWSGDGSRVVFGRGVEGGRRNLFWQAADGGAAPERLTTSTNLQWAGAWIPGGTELLFVEQRPATGGDLLRMDTARPGEPPAVLLAERFDEKYPALSRDGRWLAYASNETGPFEVYVVAYPSLTAKETISSGGAYMPAWSSDGSELFYVVSGATFDADDTMMAVSVEVAPTLRVGTPRELFRGRFRASDGIRTYDVSKNGMFLMVEDVPAKEARGTQPLRIVLDWGQELKRLIPVD